MVKKLRNTAYLVANGKEFKVEAKLSEFITNYFLILNSKYFFHQIHILKKIYKATRIGNNPP